MNSRTRTSIITAGSLAALIVGMVAGIALRQQGIDSPWISIFQLVGKLWVNVLILLVIPMVVSYLSYTVLSMIRTRLLGKLGVYALMVHVGILAGGLCFSVLSGYFVLESIGDHLPRLTLSETMAVDQAAPSSKQPTVEHLITRSDRFQKITGKAVLIMMFLSVVVAAITGRYFKRIANRLIVVSKNLSEKSMRWLMDFLLSLPMAVFALTFPMAASAGFTAVGVAGLFIVLVSILLFAYLLLMYLVVHFWGFASVGEFARAMVPPQIMAVSTRSSMATMPALMETAEHNLKVPATLSAVVIPFFVTLFRCNRVISSPFNFLFLSYVYQIPIELSTFGPFLAVQIILSFGTPGIPSGGKFVSLPIYLAAGIPLEGYILLKAVDTIPDIFKTVVNTTEVMTVVMLVARKFRWAQDADTIAVPHTP